MFIVKRSSENPVLLPDREHAWEAEAAFNGCVVKTGKTYHLVYRAVSLPESREGAELQVSSIGHAESVDGVHFTHRRQFIKPEYDWEKFGCEDPRITRIGGKYYIFYTALSTYPFGADGIKIGVAVTRDFRKIEEKHPVTPFNAKAMALFPETIKGKMAAVLTVHTDMPPAKICVALFEKEEMFWSPE